MSDIVDWKSGHPLRYTEPITSLVVADALDAAARILQRAGWHRGGMYGHDGSMCVVAALRSACGIGGGAVVAGSWEQSLFVRSTATLTDEVPLIGELASVVYWNDQACSGLAEATATLTGVAEKLRGGVGAGR